MTDPRTPEAEREALKAMIESDGWAICSAHWAKVWGPEACEQQMREAKKVSTPEDWPFEATRILDAFAGMRASVQWPVERMRVLSAKPAKSGDVFAHLRRAGR